MTDTTITIHSKTSCGYCDEARAFLASQDIPFTEIKHDDDAERAAMYDRLGLVGRARTVPQTVISSGGDDFLISGSVDLRLSGIQSLFGGVDNSIYRPAPSVVVTETAGMVVAEEGHSCCE